MLCCNLIHGWIHSRIRILPNYPSIAFWKRLAETIEFFIWDSVLSGEIDFLAGDYSLDFRGEGFLNRYVFGHFKKFEIVYTFAKVDFLAQGVTLTLRLSLLARSRLEELSKRNSILHIIITKALLSSW